MLTFSQFIIEDEFQPGKPMYVVGHEAYYDQNHQWARNNRRVAQRNVNNLQNTPQRKDIANNPHVKKHGVGVVTKNAGGGVFPSKATALT